MNSTTADPWVEAERRFSTIIRRLRERVEELEIECALLRDGHGDLLKEPIDRASKMPRTMQVYHALWARKGQCVTFQEIKKRAYDDWKDTWIPRDTIAMQISRIRCRFDGVEIENVHGIGYRLIAGPHPSKL